MDRYVLDMRASDNGFLVLHLESCGALVNNLNVIRIGNFSSLRRALLEARRINELVMLCPDCHPESFEASDDILLAENSIAGYIE